MDVHGETYGVAVTGVGNHGSGKRKFYISLDGMPEEVLFESLNEYVANGRGSGRQKASEPGHVTTAMPRQQCGRARQRRRYRRGGQPVLIAEAMKMETEINASVAGTVKAVYVANGDRVTPAEVLVAIG